MDTQTRALNYDALKNFHGFLNNHGGCCVAILLLQGQSRRRKAQGVNNEARTKARASRYNSNT